MPSVVRRAAEKRLAVTTEGRRTRLLRELVPLLHNLPEPGVGVQRGNAPDDFRIAQRFRTADVDEDVEMVRHDAVCQEPHAGEAGCPSYEVHEARALLLVKEERTVGDATDQVIAAVWKIYSAKSHAEQYII